MTASTAFFRRQNAWRARYRRPWTSLSARQMAVILALLAAFSNSAWTQANIDDSMKYLVEDSENTGRHDWPLPVGYVALADVAEGNSVARTTWDFAPFGSYDPGQGDGFQVAEIGSDGWVRNHVNPRWWQALHSTLRRPAL